MILHPTVAKYAMDSEIQVYAMSSSQKICKNVLKLYTTLSQIQ